MVRKSQSGSGNSTPSVRTSQEQRLSPTQKNNKKKKNSNKQQRSLLMWFMKWSFVLGAWGLIFLALLVLYYAHDLPDLSGLAQNRKPSITIVTESKEPGAEPIILAQYGDLYGEYIKATELPPYLIKAVLATEDRRFYDHFGVDLLGIIRAAYTNYRAKRIVQGGSTVTQQLAKNLFLTSERTFKRKIQEMILALWLEQRFTKDQILTIYLNRVYMGAGNYGIDAAAQHYFQKSARVVNLHEAAILAGLLKAPSRYAPTNNPDLALDRANQVLENMVDAEMITNKDLDTAMNQAMDLSPSSRHALTNPYFADWIVEQLPDYMGAINEDLTIVTTLDPEMQALAEKNVAGWIAREGGKRHIQQGAMIVLTPQGEIRAMVGGKNYSQSQFNRATKAQRQPGSSFKTFIYLNAFEQGMEPDDITEDSPVSIDGWRPTNYNGKYVGEVTLREAFAHSINTVAVKLAYKTGIRNLVKTAMKLGITTPLNPDLSLSLGTASVSLLEMTQAYAHFANDGNAVWAYGIKEIHDSDGNVIYKRENTTKPRIISKQSTAYMNQLLLSVVREGTGRAADLQWDAAGKTGTSQDFRDAWFVGFTSDLVAGVWVGNDDNSPMKETTGGSVPARIWRDFMQTAHHENPGTIRTDANDINDDGEDSIWNSILSTFGNRSSENENYNNDNQPAPQKNKKVIYDYPPYNR